MRCSKDKQYFDNDKKNWENDGREATGLVTPADDKSLLFQMNPNIC